MRHVEDQQATIMPLPSGVSLDHQRSDSDSLGKVTHRSARKPTLSVSDSSTIRLRASTYYHHTCGMPVANY
jgi:hypothetical protein